MDVVKVIKSHINDIIKEGDLLIGNLKSNGHFYFNFIDKRQDFRLNSEDFQIVFYPKEIEICEGQELLVAVKNHYIPYKEKVKVESIVCYPKLIVSNAIECCSLPLTALMPISGPNKCTCDFYLREAYGCMCGRIVG